MRSESIWARRAIRRERRRDFERIQSIRNERRSTRVAFCAARLCLAHRGCGALRARRGLGGCSGADQTISFPSTPGPIFGTGGNVTVNSGASIAGGPTGVYAQSCGISVLANSGAIGGANGVYANASPGGVGVPVGSGQINRCTRQPDRRTISGGNGGGPAPRPGGAGVSNHGTITTLPTMARLAADGGGGLSWRHMAARACRTRARSRP